jgi:hypothetical protein
MHRELDAQRKQFSLIMKQNSALLVAMAKGNGRGDGGGSGGGGGGKGGRGRGGGSRHRNCGTKAMCPNCNKMVVHTAANCFMLPANKDKIPSWYKPPKTD